MRSLRRAVRPLIGAVVATLLLAGCLSIVPGSPKAGERVTVKDADLSVITGAEGGRIDQLAAAAVTDIRQYWRQTFQATFGEPWQDLKGFYSVDTTDPTAKPPPCVDRASDVQGNAFYCPTADTIAYDRAQLFPVLVEDYGEAGVVVVLAHEIGHAVHNRLGVNVAAQRRNPQLYPTIVVESMADCYAGSFMRWVTDGKAAHVQIDSDQLDAALGSLVSFRDPLGTSTRDRGAHGNAFDRVSSFQDGYQQGPLFCSKITGQNRQFTLREFTSLDDLRNRGNLALPQLIDGITTDLNDFFSRFVQAKGGTWRPPALGADPECSGDQGPVAFCPTSDAVAADQNDRELARLHEIGDYATGALLASRYGLAALESLGKPVEGDTAARAALCLAGGYTSEILTRTEGFQLSPGDLDEAVVVLLRFDYAERDAAGNAPASTGFDRVGVFRGGTLDGADSCELG
jgi:predicted metalloprotease